MIGNKLLQSESMCARRYIGAASREGRGFQCSSFSQQARALSGMNLTGREHVETGVRMHIVVPRIELAEVIFRFSLGCKVTWEGWLSFDSGEVRLDVGIVVGCARPTEQLWDAEFPEVSGGRVRSHLSAAVAERGGPGISGLIQQAFVDQAVIPQGLDLGADQVRADAPGDVLAAPMIEQAVQVAEDMGLAGMQVGDIGWKGSAVFPSLRAVSPQPPPSRTSKLALHPAFPHNHPVFTGECDHDDIPYGIFDRVSFPVVCSPIVQHGHFPFEPVLRFAVGWDDEEIVVHHFDRNFGRHC
jgi:hypothetical protein